MLKAEYKRIVECDKARYNGVNVTFFRKVKNPALSYTLALRKVQYLKGKRFRKISLAIAKWKLFRWSVKYGYQIGHDAKIGKGLYLGHYGTIVVNGACKIGDNVNIAVGVTLGQENRGKRKGTPTILNNVFIGANSVVVGNITVGNNVLIAPLTLVNFDVPDNSIVIGNPAKIIPCENATEGYINFVLKEEENV